VIILGYMLVSTFNANNKLYMHFTIQTIVRVICHNIIITANIVLVIVVRQQKKFQLSPESYNGAVRDNYSWSQSISDVDVHVMVYTSFSPYNQYR